MGVKAKKTLKKRIQKAASEFGISDPKSSAPDFLPLECGPARKIPDSKPQGNKATVLYIGRIPHGFYENEMQAYFHQFGTIKRLRMGRNKKTGKSRHFGFIEFEDPQVAEVVAGCMHNYLLFEHLLQVHLIPPGNVHPKLWSSYNPRYKPVDRLQIDRQNQNKERTLHEQQKMVQNIIKCDQKRRKRIEAAGIDYECPALLGNIQPAPKKIKFDED